MNNLEIWLNVLWKLSILGILGMIGIGIFAIDNEYDRRFKTIETMFKHLNEHIEEQLEYECQRNQKFRRHILKKLREGAPPPRSAVQ